MKHVTRVIVLFGFLVAYVIELSFDEGFFVSLQVKVNQCFVKAEYLYKKTCSIGNILNSNYRKNKHIIIVHF